MRMRNLFLVIVMAGLTFGGAFNCSDDDDDDDDAFAGSSPTTGSGSVDTGGLQGTTGATLSLGTWGNAASPLDVVHSGETATDVATP